MSGCKNVMWTAGCTFAGQVQGQAQFTLLTYGPPCPIPTLPHASICCWPPPPPPCRPIFNTRLCTLVPRDLNQGGVLQAEAAADCKNVMWTAGCTFAGQQPNAMAAGAEDCKNVMWTAGCTFAGQSPGAAQGGIPPTWICGQAQAQPAGGAQITLHTFGYPCHFDPTCATMCFICPPFGDAQRTDDCGKVLTTLACTLAGGGRVGAADDCGNVLTTLVCTLKADAGAGTDRPLCVTLLTAVPTWCQPDKPGSADCKHVLWTAGCTFAGQKPGCPGILQTTICTIGNPPSDLKDCGNVLATLACTLSAERLPKDEGGQLGCKDVLWTAGCTFKELGKGEQCGDVLTTLACTLMAAPAAGTDGRADCKDVLWTAGCTFAATPSERDDKCKVVAWTAGCTF